MIRKTYSLVYVAAHKRRALPYANMRNPFRVSAVPIFGGITSQRGFALCSRMNAVTVRRWTFNRRPMALMEILCARRFWISASRPVSFLRELLLPLGRPSTIPSARFRARASFVRWEMRLLKLLVINRKHLAVDAHKNFFSNLPFFLF